MHIKLKQNIDAFNRMKLPVRFSYKSVLVLQICTLVLSSVFSTILATPVHAAAAGSSYFRSDRMKAATDPGDILVSFTTSSTAATEGKFKITLDSEWVSATHFSATASNFTTTTTGIPAGMSAMPITGSVASAVSGNTITFTLSSALTDSTTYAFFITGSGFIANPAASTSIVHTMFTTSSGDVVQDTIDVAVPVIADDQIVVTAAVAPSFTFVLSGNTSALGTLSTGSVSSGTSQTVTITTNAANGWNAWVRSANEGLDSTSTGATIDTTGTVDDTPSTLSAGTEGYVLDVDETTDAADGGTVTVDAEYDGGDTSSGGTLSDTFETIATADGTADGDVITLIPRAAIAGQTESANDYTDTLTVVGAGVF